MKVIRTRGCQSRNSGSKKFFENPDGRIFYYKKGVENLKTKHIGIAALIIIIVLGVIAYFSFFNPSPSKSVQPNNTLTAPYPQVFLTVVSNFSNSYLNQSFLDKNLSTLIPNLIISYVDFNSILGQQLQSQVNASFLPFYVFNSSILNSPAFPSLLKVLAQKSNGDYLLDSFETNQGALINSQAQPLNLQLFVTSYDYHAWMAENQTYNFLGNASNSVNFSIHYIIGLNKSLNSSQYFSLNGPNEMEEDARQLCIQQQNSSDFKYYLNCLNQNLLQDFNTSNLTIGAMFFRAALSSKNCIEGVGAYNETQIALCSETCFNQTNSTPQACIINETLVQNEYLLNQQYRVIATPTFVFNNKYVHVGVLSADQIKNIFCQLNQC